MMDDQGIVHPIACESCRNKKSKCDREIPICSQCSAVGIACRYPPVNKRGIPSGYISFVEQRLLETEIVVLELLTAIYNSQNPIDAQPLSDRARQKLFEASQKQAKTARIEEWNNLPLRTSEQQHNWWTAKSSCIADADVEATRNPRVPDESPAASSETWGASPVTPYNVASSPREAEQQTQHNPRTAIASVSSWHNSLPQALESTETFVPIGATPAVANSNPSGTYPMLDPVSDAQQTLSNTQSNLASRPSATQSSLPTTVRSSVSQDRWRKYF